MKTILKIIIGILIPSLFLTYAISYSLKKGELDGPINTREEINFLYLMTVLIVMVPVCIYGFFYFFEVNVDGEELLEYLSFGASSSLFFGILISFIYLSVSSSLKPIEK